MPTLVRHDFAKWSATEADRERQIFLPPLTCTRGDLSARCSSLVNRDDTSSAVDGEVAAVGDAAGGVAGGDDGVGDVPTWFVQSRDDATVPYDKGRRGATSCCPGR